MTHDPSDAFAHEVQRRAYGQRLEVFVGSRDAGHTLTHDGLEEGISLRRLIDTSRDLSEYADQAIAIVRAEYHPRLDCREGCSYCCRKPGVLVTVPELLRIVQHVQDTFDAETASAVRERARRYVQQLAGRSFDEPTDESVPCPLLSDERCTVYEIRPLTCRGYNSTSVDACRKAHGSTNVLVPIFAFDQGRHRRHDGRGGRQASRDRVQPLARRSRHGAEHRSGGRRGVFASGHQRQ